MAFEGSVQHQTVKRRLLAERLEYAGSHETEYTQIISGVHKRLHLLAIPSSALIGVQVEDRVVEILLGGEVAEQNRFAHPGGYGNILGLCAAETVTGKDVDRDLQQLAVTV